MQCHNNALKTIDISNTSLLMTDANYAFMGCQSTFDDITVIMHPKQGMYFELWRDEPYNARIVCGISYSTLYTPSSLTEIASEAFANGRFDKVVLGTQVKKIGSNAFKDCKLLYEVYFYSNDVSIAEDAFSGCTDFTIVCAYGSAAHLYAEKHGFNYACLL